MKSRFTLTTLAIALLSIAPRAIAATCSTATVAGTWGFTLTGTVILPAPTGPVPLAAVLHGTADVNGNLSGVEARNLGGNYADETFTGTWTVSSDCVGTATVFFSENGQLVRTSVVTIAFDDSSKQARMVQKSLTLPNGVELPIIATVEGTKH
jgi:hypothetical protein